MSQDLSVSQSPQIDAAQTNPITPKLVLNVFRQWWKIAMPFGLLLAAAGCAIVLLTYKPRYEAKTLLWIDDEKPYVLRPVVQDDNFVKDQQGLIRSSLVLGRVISRPEIGALEELADWEDPVEALADMIRVKPAGGTKLFHLTCTAESPESAQLIANAVTESYFRFASEFEAGRTARLIELLEQSKLEKEGLIERLKESIRVLSRQQDGGDVAAVSGLDQNPAMNLLFNPLADLQSRLNAAQVEQEVMKSQIQALEEYVQSTPVEITEQDVEKVILESPEVLEIRQSILRRRQEASETLARSARGQEDPQYVKLQRQIEAEEAFLEETVADWKSSLKEQLEAEQVKARDQQLAEMKTSLDGQRVRERVLQEVLARQTEKWRLARTDNLELGFRRRELGEQEGLLDAISARLHLLRTERLAPARIELKESADVPRRPVEWIPYKQLLLAGSGGFALPFLLALLWELQLQRVTDTRQLVQRGKLSVVGEIVDARGFHHPGKHTSKAQRLFEESVDQLRTHLVLSGPPEDLRVVAVLSAASGEGKTTVAAQLAISLARASGEGTLLIDSDMRSPDLHSLFDVELEPGLAQVLSQESPLAEAVVPSGLDGLDLLTAGRLYESPHKLVGKRALHELLRQARSSYRYVVIDTPPVLPAGESLILARLSDAAILCVRRDVSRVDQVERSRERLQAAGARILGFVLNGVPRRRYEYSYGYYHGR